MTLIDNHNRCLDYLRLAVTDRCNLRCRYCMPDRGIKFMEQKVMLSWEEMKQMCDIFVHMGIQKLRITGGEPFVRKGLIGFLRHIREKQPQLMVGVTTNGILLRDYLSDLKNMGVSKLNISLDTLNPIIFEKITRRSGFLRVLQAIEMAHEMGFHLKINTVVLPNLNDNELMNFVELTRDLAITVRFIEPMPFTGCEKTAVNQYTYEQILESLKKRYHLQPINKSGTGVDFQFRVPGYQGKVGIIAGYTRKFCKSCSRLRVSAQGQLRTCLYGAPVLNLREMLRAGAGDEDIIESIQTVVQCRFENGFEAEKARDSKNFSSMASIGG